MAREKRTDPKLRAQHRVAMSARKADSIQNSVIKSKPSESTQSKGSKKTDASQPLRDAQGRFIKADTITKPRAAKKVVKTKAAPQKPVRPAKTECVICATTKTTKRSFKASDVADSCHHFENVCDLCIQKQIRTKMSARELTVAHLSCMFTECKAVLGHNVLSKVLPKALFESWDASIVTHLLAADASYVACLNPKCGVYFSTEGCVNKHEVFNSKSKSKYKTKNTTVKSACPHCDYKMCLSCNRPWHSGSCDNEKQLEDEQSEQTIKRLGAKPCPKCSITIEKDGGCDHMRCQRCSHNFCFECLGAFTGSTETHAETCSHRRPMIVHDAGNFVDQDATIAQINTLIARAQRDRDAGRQPPLVDPGALHFLNPPAAPVPTGAVRAANIAAAEQERGRLVQRRAPPGRPRAQGQLAGRPDLQDAHVVRPPLLPGMLGRALNELLGGGQRRWPWQE